MPNILSTVCFLLTIFQSIGTCVQFLDRHRAKKQAIEKGELNPKLGFPWLAVLLMTGSIIACGFGFWLIWHPPTQQVAALNPSSPIEHSPPNSHSAPPRHASPRPTNPPKKKASESAPPTQYGTGSEQTSTGDVDQSGDGCQIKNVGGSNNTFTNTCALALPKISERQKTKIIDAMSKMSLSEAKRTDVMYEYGADGGKDLAGKIKDILNSLGIPSELEPGTTIGGCGPDAPSGISFSCVSADNEFLADAINSALSKAGVIGKPIPKVQLSSSWPDRNPSLIIMIRKP